MQYAGCVERALGVFSDESLDTSAPRQEGRVPNPASDVYLSLWVGLRREL
jgi:hypothetical protein